VYTLEKDNSRVDTLSRQLDITKTKEITKSIILKTYKDGSLGPLKGLWRLKISIEIKVLEELQEAIIQQHYNDLVHRHSRVA
jgi:hypothetical protein